MHISELLDQRPDAVEAWSTGLAELDRLTGGFSLECLWVLTGAPGAGKTTLLTQFVHRLATAHDFTVQFHTARPDSLAEVSERFIALACRRVRRRPAEEDTKQPPPSAQARLAALRDANLDVHTRGGWSIGNDWGDAERVLLAIDEPEFNRPPVLAREGLDELRRFADRPGIVMVTVPRSHCFEAATHGDRLREEWASVADVMVEIVPTDDVGSVMLRVLLNRRGPTGPVLAVQQPHLARFVQSDVR